MRLARALLLASVAGVACARPPAAPEAPPATWDLDVVAPDATPHLVRVEATFRNVGTPRLVVSDDATPLVRDLLVDDGAGWRAPPRSAGAWIAPGCVRGCRVRYTLDLDALASRCDGEIDCAARVGAATLSPALAWILHPQPKGDAAVAVRVRADPDRFATGLRATREPLVYRFRSPELDEGAFTAFGPLRRTRVDVAEAAIDVVMLGDPIAMSDREVAAWIERAARCVASLYGRFPVRRATVFVVPVDGRDEVVFGKVLSLAGASVALLVGDRMTAKDAQSDWVLVHELFHLGFPSFRGEGRWLGEGLATYYEPILRARAGWIAPTHVWSDFARQMPRGLAEPGAAAGLAQREDLDSIYWGGALFALMTDVEIRARTHGARSLDDVVRAALARGGDATHVWTVADVVRLGDEVTGTTVLRDMYARHAARGEPIDLGGLLGSLGVEAAPSGATIRDDAPLAPIRRAITAREED